MLKRIVFWTVKGQDPGQIKDNALRIKQLLQTLKGKIPGMLDLEVGINIHESPDQCHIAFTTLFDNRQSLQTYDTHPEHEKIKPEVAELRAQRYVVVYEVIDKICESVNQDIIGS